MNRTKPRCIFGRLNTAALAFALLILPAMWLPLAFAEQNEMAFTAKIRPWGTSSLDFTIQNDTLEPITGLTVSMDGTDHKFSLIYANSMTRSVRVLEPLYVQGDVGLVREVWYGPGGEGIGNLTGWGAYPNSPNNRNMVTGSFEAPSNVADNYGQRIHGYLLAPESGVYTFWIAGDDNSALYISTDTNPANATLVASVPGWTASRQWDKYPASQVGTRTLVTGQYYYVMALMKEGGGSDNLAVGWKRPNGLEQRPMPANVFRIAPPGGEALDVSDPSSGSDQSDMIRIIDIAGLTRGSSLFFQTALTAPPANAAKILWNNGASRQNATITVFGANGGRGELTIPDTASNESGLEYVFLTEKRPRTLTVKSEVFGSGAFVSNFIVRVRNSQGGLIEEREHPAGTVTLAHLSDGMRVEIVAAGAVYQDANGEFLYDDSSIPPDSGINSPNPPRQRFVASGLSVNNTPQTADPTQYAFDINGDTEVKIRWRHDYALLLTHDFSATESPERDPQGNPWAGPLVSSASGNPTPDATRIHWIEKGEEVVAQVDGQMLDFNRPGLDIRYVPKAYRARGAARGVFTQFAIYTNAFTVGQSPPQRQQVDSFVMNGWGSIEYIWQIQFGVKVNVDDASRSALPRVFQVVPGGGTEVEIGSLEGTFWFNPGDAVKVSSAANETFDPTSLALSGWISGDSFYFSSSGDINSQDGSLLSGGPVLESGNPVALWVNSFIDSNGRKYRGLSIPSLRRPAQVLWTYGEQSYLDTVRIGEYLLQTNEALLASNPELAAMLLQEPSQINVISVAGNNQNVSTADVTVWDSNAKRLYPLVPGQFRVTWTSTNGNSVQVLANVILPEQPHYPHVASSPPVQLTPDPSGTFFFKELKYTENDAAISGGSLFTAETPGWTVLLFGEIKSIGRGDPMEYLRVRTVRTRAWNDAMPSAATTVIGRAISDSSLDLANLGTGYIKFEDARYNPNVYDASKLDGLTARSVYDMNRLRSTTAEKLVVQRDALPGPIIPVNLHPGASSEQRIVVVWYYDPALTDEILWPYVARSYLPRWPTTEAEGLSRIVIASQFGSESLNAQQQDQLVAPAVTNITSDGAGGLLTSVVARATTYNPTRIQQPTVYVQNDPSLPGYNPNEEHGLMAPSLRFAQVSPRPPAVYALRNNDLNRYSATSSTEVGQPTDYTSHPYVLVQYFDTALDEFRMRVYKIEKEDQNIPNYKFANQTLVALATNQTEVSATPQALAQQPHVVMEAGEPVIPFYPLGVVIGASPSPETFGVNIKSQATYWEDHKGTSWAVSGGENAWFTFSIYYPMSPDFWWPPNQPGRVAYDAETGQKRAVFPNIGDSVSFMPNRIQSLKSLAINGLVDVSVETNARPNRILYKSDWPAVAPVLKAGETLTFSGGEYLADHPNTLVIDGNGNSQTVLTPGLPGVVAFAVGEVVYDALNPRGLTTLLTNSWTVRMGQVLDKRTAVLPIGSFPTALLPASGRTRVSGGKYVFNDLPASLQKRFRYDPLAQSIDPLTGLTVSGRLEIEGMVNDKRIGDTTLTASPGAVYVLEPNILTAGDRDALLALASDTDSAWRTAVQLLYDRSRNPAEVE